MKFKKVLAVGLASLTLLSASATTVSAHSKGTLVQLMSDIPAYNAKGKKIKKARPFSKHVVDTLPGLTDQIKKAFTLDGEDKLEAYQEIAQQLGMDPNSITSSTQKGFEDRLKSYVSSMDDAKNWIESGGK